MDARTMVEMMDDEQEGLWEHRIRRKEAVGDPEKFAELRKQEKAEIDTNVQSFINELNDAVVASDDSDEEVPQLDSEPINFNEENDKPAITTSSDGKTIVLQNIHIQNLTIHLT